MHVGFSGHKCEVFGRTLFSEVGRGGIYELQGCTSRFKYTKNDLRHWYQRLVHLNYNSILELENSGKVKGLKIVGPHVLNDKCEACALSKITKKNTRYKFRERGKAGVIVGHDTERKGYFIYFSSGGPRIQRTCDVIFMQACSIIAKENSTDTALRMTIEPCVTEMDSRGR